jgi:type VI secretion system ImpC/EvpB family protein
MVTIVDPDVRGRVLTILEHFQAVTEPTELIDLWFGRHGAPARPTGARQLIRALNRDVAMIDELLARQVDAIIHHRRFQRLEASWRGVEYLVDQVDQHVDPDAQNVKVRLLSASWKEVCKDLDRAIEFDQSQVFQKVYEAEFGSPGGKPYGVLLGDYEVSHRPGPGRPTDDVAALRSMAAVAAAAFAPFVVGAHPSLLGLDSFRDLQLPMNLSRTFESLEYTRWNSLRKHPDTRFVGLLMPRVLMRRPYQNDGSRNDGFVYQEDVWAPDHSRYLWGSPVFAFGAVLVRCFAESGWLANIRGTPNAAGMAGVATGLPIDCFSTDLDGLAPKYSTDVLITDTLEKELADLGFIALCRCKETELSAFYGNGSMQRAEKYDTEIARANAKISTMLQYMLCTGRFAHFLKIMARDKTGSFADPDELQKDLRKWLMRYCNASPTSLALEARFPLREAKVEVREFPGRPGSFQCVLHLRPQFQLDHIVSNVRLVTELAPPRSGS